MSELAGVFCHLQQIALSLVANDGESVSADWTIWIRQMFCDRATDTDFRAALEMVESALEISTQ